MSHIDKALLAYLGSLVVTQGRLAGQPFPVFHGNGGSFVVRLHPT